MPRLNVVEPSSATGTVKEIFDGPLQGMHFNIFKGFANSPALLKGYVGLAGALSEGVLSKKEAEVVALTLGEANGCDYCTAAHTAIGQSAGLTQEETMQARLGSIADDPKLDALARFTTAIHEKKGNVGDEDVEAFRGAGYGDDAIAEVIGHYALNTLTNYFNHVNQTAVDLPAAPKIG